MRSTHQESQLKVTLLLTAILLSQASIAIARSPAVEPTLEIVDSKFKGPEISPASKDLGYSFGNHQVAVWGNHKGYAYRAPATHNSFSFSTLFFLTIVVGVVFGTFGFIYAKDDPELVVDWVEEAPETGVDAEVIPLHSKTKSSRTDKRKAS